MACSLLDVLLWFFRVSATTSIDRNPANKTDLSHDILYDAQFAFLFVGEVCFVLSNTILTHYARWVEFLGGSVADVGWVMGLGAGLALIARPWVGQCINRMGTCRVWNIGLVILGLSVSANFFLESMNCLVHLARAGLMLGGGLAYISALTHAAQRAPRHRQTEALSVFGAAGFVSIMSGPYLGDLILGSGQRNRADFVLLFSAALGLIVLALMCWSFVKPLNLRGPRSSIGIKDFWNTSRDHWPGGVVLVGAAFGFSMTVPFAFLPVYVDHSLLSSRVASPVGMFFLAYGGWGLFVRLTSKAVADRVGRRKVLCLGLLLATLGLCSFLLVTPERWWLLFVPAILTGSGHALCFPTINALILGPFPNSRRGTGSALAVMFADLGTSVGAPLLGIIASSAGFSAVFLVAGSTTLAALLFYAYLSVPIWREQWNATRL